MRITKVYADFSGVLINLNGIFELGADSQMKIMVALISMLVPEDSFMESQGGM